MSPSQRRSLAVLALLLAAAVGGAQWVRHHAERDLGTQLAAQARPGDIRLISSVDCVYCTRARVFLQAHGVPFAECFVERDADCAARYRALGAAGTPTVLVRERPQLGFDARRVLRALQADAPPAAS